MTLEEETMNVTADSTIRSNRQLEAEEEDEDEFAYDGDQDDGPSLATSTARRNKQTALLAPTTTSRGLSDSPSGCSYEDESDESSTDEEDDDDESHLESAAAAATGARRPHRAPPARQSLMCLLPTNMKRRRKRSRKQQQKQQQKPQHNRLLSHYFVPYVRHHPADIDSIGQIHITSKQVEAAGTSLLLCTTSRPCPPRQPLQADGGAPLLPQQAAVTCTSAASLLELSRSLTCYFDAIRKEQHQAAVVDLTVSSSAAAAAAAAAAAPDSLPLESTAVVAAAAAAAAVSDDATASANGSLEPATKRLKTAIDDGCNSSTSSSSSCSFNAAPRPTQQALFPPPTLVDYKPTSLLYPDRCIAQPLSSSQYDYSSSSFARLQQLSTCSIMERKGRRSLEHALSISSRPRLVMEANSPYRVVHANAAYGLYRSCAAADSAATINTNNTNNRRRHGDASSSSPSSSSLLSAAAAASSSQQQHHNTSFTTATTTNESSSSSSSSLLFCSSLEAAVRRMLAADDTLFEILPVWGSDGTVITHYLVELGASATTSSSAIMNKMDDARDIMQENNSNKFARAVG